MNQNQMNQPMMLLPIASINGLPIFAADEELELDNLPDIAYVIDAEGWKLFRRNCLTVSLINIKSLSGLTKLTEQCKLSFSHKIPSQLLDQVVAFFQAVYDRDKSEAVGYLYYNPAASPSWQFIPPKQSATSASCKYDEAPRIDNWLLAGTIHSHGSMSAFHSGTDHKDESHFDGIHITIGKVDSKSYSPEFAYSVVVQGVRFSCEANQIVEGFSCIEVPTSWMEAVEVKPELPKTCDNSVILFGTKFDVSNSKFDAANPPSGSNPTPEKLSRKQRKKQQRDSGNSINSNRGFFDARRFMWGDYE